MKKKIKIGDQCMYTGLHVMLAARHDDNVVALALVYKEGYGALFYGDAGGLAALPKSKWVTVETAE